MKVLPASGSVVASVATVEPASMFSLNAIAETLRAVGGPFAISSLSMVTSEILLLIEPPTALDKTNRNDLSGSYNESPSICMDTCLTF